MSRYANPVLDAVVLVAVWSTSLGGATAVALNILE